MYIERALSYEDVKLTILKHKELHERKFKLFTPKCVFVISIF